MGRRSVVGELIGSQSEVLSISINPKWHRQDHSWGGNQYGSVKEGRAHGVKARQTQIPGHRPVHKATVNLVVGRCSWPS